MPNPLESRINCTKIWMHVEGWRSEPRLRGGLRDIERIDDKSSDLLAISV
jgi:hypothetical protein